MCLYFFGWGISIQSFSSQAVSRAMVEVVRRRYFTARPGFDPYMARGYLSDTRDDASTPKGEWWLGFSDYRCQMQYAILQSDPDIGGKRRNSSFGADAQLGPHSHSGEPSKRGPDPP